MKIFHCDILSFPLPEQQEFLVSKYELLTEAVVASGLCARRQLRTAPPATLEQITGVHDTGFVERLLAGEMSAEEIRDVGLPWSAEIVERARRTAGATIEACRWALAEGFALHLGGGTHHAFAGRARGLCWLNDCAIAARAMIAEGLADRVLILDCDVHQGDGTASIFREDPEVFTFSIHGGYSYPYRKQPADLDIDLPAGTGDGAYLDALDEGLDTALQRFEPDLVIYLAGADVYRDDRFGRLALSIEGVARRDRMVFERFAEKGTPVAVTLAGGYARQIEEAVEIHLQTAHLASEFHRGARGRVEL